MGCLETKEEKEKKAKLRADIEATEKEIAKFDTEEAKAFCAKQDTELQSLQKERNSRTKNQ